MPTLCTERTTAMTMHKDKFTVPSKELARLHDELDEALLDAIHKFAEGIAKRPLNADALETVGYDYGLIPRMEIFVQRFISEAYGIDYDSDGTNF